MDKEDYWTKNNLIKPQRIVVCAANKCNDTIVLGVRHYDRLMNKHIRLLPEGLWKKAQVVQGFIDQFGDFMDRVEALQVAKESSQPLDMKRNGSKTKLFSEGIY